jgi:hypothetical protein
MKSSPRTDMWDNVESSCDSLKTIVCQNASLTEHQTSENGGQSRNGTNGATSGPILPLIDEVDIQNC